MELSDGPLVFAEHHRFLLVASPARCCSLPSRSLLAVNAYYRLLPPVLYFHYSLAALSHRLLVTAFTACVYSLLSLISYRRRRLYLLAVTADIYLLAPLGLLAATACC